MLTTFKVKYFYADSRKFKVWAFNVQMKAHFSKPSQS